MPAPAARQTEEPFETPGGGPARKTSDDRDHFCIGSLGHELYHGWTIYTTLDVTELS
jgi:hypothetical protein